MKSGSKCNEQIQLLSSSKDRYNTEALKPSIYWVIFTNNPYSLSLCLPLSVCLWTQYRMFCQPFSLSPNIAATDWANLISYFATIAFVIAISPYPPVWLHHIWSCWECLFRDWNLIANDGSAQNGRPVSCCLRTQIGCCAVTRSERARGDDFRCSFLIVTHTSITSYTRRAVAIDTDLAPPVDRFHWKWT